MASIFKPKTGTAKECNTSEDVTINFILAECGKIKGTSTASNQKLR